MVLVGFKPDLWRPTGFLQCFDTVGLVIRPVKNRSRNDLLCVEWDVKPYTLTQSLISAKQTNTHVAVSWWLQGLSTTLVFDMPDAHSDTLPRVKKHWRITRSRKVIHHCRRREKLVMRSSVCAGRRETEQISVLGPPAVQRVNLLQTSQHNNSKDVIRNNHYCWLQHYDTAFQRAALLPIVGWDFLKNISSALKYWQS